MKYSIYQGNQVLFSDRTKAQAEAIKEKYNLMHKENQYRVVLQSSKKQGSIGGFYE